MCTRVGTRPCPVCRSLGWRPPQRGKRRPRPPTHGQLPSLLLKPKNLKKSGPGFIRGRVERTGPKRTTRSAALTPLRQSWDLFLTFWNLFLTFYVRPIRKPVTPPSKTAQDVGTPDGPHCGRGTGAWALPGPPCRPRPSPASPPGAAAGRTPEAAGRVARLFCSASEGRQAPSSHRVQGGPGPGLSSRPSCPLLRFGGFAPGQASGGCARLPPSLFISFLSDTRPVALEDLDNHPGDASRRPETHPVPRSCKARAVSVSWDD